MSHSSPVSSRSGTMATLKLGDIVVVNKLDRLGRSTRELLDLIDRIGKAAASDPRPLSKTPPAWRRGGSC
jgi:hypothetical protein